MSDEAINFKKENQNLDYNNMGLDELNKLPSHLGVIDFKITKTSFKMLNIFNDDASAVKYFWHGSFDLTSLDLWYELSKKEGIYIDIGAHTGLYTMTSLQSNPLNNVISIEPYYLNTARLITNLRLNGMKKNVQTFLSAVSNSDSFQKFNLETQKSHLSKGGKIDNVGEPVKTVKLDSLDFKKSEKKIKGIKIDTEVNVSEWDNVLTGFSDGDVSIAVVNSDKMTTNWFGFASFIGLRYYVRSWWAIDIKTGYLTNYYDHESWKFRGKTVTGPVMNIDGLPIVTVKVIFGW